MPKLIVKPDGSIAYDYDDSIPVEAAKKQSIEQIKNTKNSIKGKDFKTFTPTEKDALLELLLKMHNLV